MMDSFARRIAADGDLGAIKMKLTSISLDMQNLHHKASEATIRKIARETYEAEGQRLEKLRDDAVKVLRLLKEKGIVTQEELTEVLRG